MPSRHSGSSHSGGSRSSFSSSRSSFSSSSRPSSHSSSSHSSSSFGSLFGSSSSNSRHRNTYYTPKVRRYNYYNPYGYYNPWGFDSWFRPRPRVIYCYNHNYTYFPVNWTNDDGKEIRAGYYDENGKYYEKKPYIEKKPDRIYTKCPNCGYVKDYNYMDFYDLENCPNCGTRMLIANDDDDIFIDEKDYDEQPIWYYILQGLMYVILGAGIVFLIIFGFKSCEKKMDEIREYNIQYVQNNQNTNYGSVLYLQKSGDGYTVIKEHNANNEADKILYKDSDDNYYDKEADFYLYYSEEFKVWQYWYEPISGNFGDYGWMEHDSEGWWVEVDHDNWIKVPSNYDTSKLYFIK